MIKNAFLFWVLLGLLTVTSTAIAATNYRSYFKPAGGTIGTVSGITCGSGTIFTTSLRPGYFWVSTSGRVSAGKKILGISKTTNESVCYTDGENPTPVSVNVVSPYGVSR